jgi:hypothetical protein
MHRKTFAEPLKTAHWAQEYMAGPKSRRQGNTFRVRYMIGQLPGNPAAEMSDPGAGLRRNKKVHKRTQSHFWDKSRKPIQNDPETRDLNGGGSRGC